MVEATKAEVFLWQQTDTCCDHGCSGAMPSIEEGNWQEKVSGESMRTPVTYTGEIMTQKFPHTVVGHGGTQRGTENQWAREGLDRRKSHTVH